MNLPRIVIAGTASSVGKTTVALGLMGALKKRGLRVQGFKVGPDYIDPSHHTLVTGLPSRNLDSWMSSENQVREIFERHARQADISIIEGVMGLFDGYGPNNEQGSTAHVAKLLGAPVLLVIDAKAMAGSAGALVLGFQTFDPELRLAGVIANNLGGERHFEHIQPAIESRTGLRLLGYIPHDPSLKINERHLGLIPEQENQRSVAYYERIADVIIRCLDLDQIIGIAQKAGSLGQFERTLFTRAVPSNACKETPVIGVARDQVFHFYYQDNLDLLASLGAKLIFFSPLQDAHLPPNLDLIYLGGGFPELFAAKLSQNQTMIKAIRRFGQTGKPIYAECGGLMYLGQAITTFEDQFYPMVELLPVTTSMQKKRIALGYSEVTAKKDTLLCRQGEKFRGHEFHWSEMKETGPVEYVFTSSQRNGAVIKPDGIVVGSVLASYTHAYFLSNPHLASTLISTATQGRISTPGNCGAAGDP